MGKDIYYKNINQLMFGMSIIAQFKILMRIFKLKKHKSGKEYYSDGKLKFEGEYLEGKKWNETGYNKDNK